MVKIKQQLHMHKQVSHELIKGKTKHGVSSQIVANDFAKSKRPNK